MTSATSSRCRSCGSWGSAGRWFRRLVDTGLVGFGAFGWFILAVLAEGRQGRRRSGVSSWERVARRGVLAACLLTVFCIFFNTLFGVKAPWLMFGLTGSAGRVASRPA
jgi:hypothetical protein